MRTWTLLLIRWFNVDRASQMYILIPKSNQSVESLEQVSWKAPMILFRNLEQIPGGTNDLNLNLKRGRSISPKGTQRSPSHFFRLDLCICHLRSPVKSSLALHMRETISLARHSCTHCYTAALACMPRFLALQCLASLPKHCSEKIKGPLMESGMTTTRCAVLATAIGTEMMAWNHLRAACDKNEVWEIIMPR